METKLVAIILVLQFSSLFIIYSGNEQTPLGKKVRALGFQLFGGAAILLGSTFGFRDSSFEYNILFYTGLLISTISIFQLSEIIKKFAVTSA